MIDIKLFSEQQHIKFGTSGIRALNSALTDKVCYLYTLAFLQHLENNHEAELQKCIIAGDLRANTDHIIKVVYQALVDKGYAVEYCGKIPTPALCYYAMQQKCPGIMITGSHIPDNMNGMKYYKSNGEILKSDEQAILSQSVSFDEDMFGKDDDLTKPLSQKIPVNHAAYQAYIERYTNFFPANALGGMRIGLYAHSSVAAVVLMDILKKLGAEVVEFGLQKTFHAVDTEALSDVDISIAKEYLKNNRLDAIVSTDGDGDRPLLTDEFGSWVHGDVIGILCAILLKAKYVVVPFSCNHSIDSVEQFQEIIRAKIGSPYIIEKMNELIQKGLKNVIGFESNGGVLVGTDCLINDKTLSPLPTRDGILPVICILTYLNKEKIKLSQLIQSYFHSYTHSDSIKPFPMEQAKLFFEFLQQDGKTSENIQTFFEKPDPIKEIDYFDGMNIAFENGEMIYLRQSGNSPELRCYTESTTKEKAKNLNTHCLNAIKKWMKKHART